MPNVNFQKYSIGMNVLYFELYMFLCNDHEFAFYFACSLYVCVSLLLLL